MCALYAMYAALNLIRQEKQPDRANNYDIAKYDVNGISFLLDKNDMVKLKANNRDKKIS